MNRDDLTRHLMEGAREASTPASRRTRQTPAPPPPPRTVRVNDRTEDLVYAGAWFERDSCPAEDDDEGREEEFAADWDDGEDGDDDGAIYTPLGGGR